MMYRIFMFPGLDRYVLFETRALEHIYAHAQRRFWHKEAGGEIFSADPNSSNLVVAAAAGPNPEDCRSRSFFNPDRQSTTRNREQMMNQGLHAVGLWHTHPEAKPSPSHLDQETTETYLRSFEDERERYLMVILGNRAYPLALSVWSAESRGANSWVELIERSF